MIRSLFPIMSKHKISPRDLSEALRICLEEINADQDLCLYLVEIRSDNDGIVMEFFLGGKRYPDLMAFWNKLSDSVYRSLKKKNLYIMVKPVNLHSGVFEE